MTPTKSEVKKAMTAAGVSFELRGAGRKWEIELADETGLAAFLAAFPGHAGGYKTGYGAWVLRPGYVSKGEWSDPTSRNHY